MAYFMHELHMQTNMHGNLNKIITFGLIRPAQDLNPTK